MSPKKVKGRVLVTAGSTWVKIDEVRVITNIFSGNIGCKIASSLNKAGYKVTLLLGQGNNLLPEELNGVEVVRFKYFDDLFSLMKKKITEGDFIAVIHSAAVSDYQPCHIRNGKIRSDHDFLSLKLKKTVKIVDLIKKWDKDVLLIKFKLEVNVSKSHLFKTALISRSKSNADFIVANDYKNVSDKYKAYIFNEKGLFASCNSRLELVNSMVNILQDNLNG